MAKQPQTLPFLKNVPMKSARAVRMVDPRTLTEGQKRILWEGIKKENPGLAKMMRSDPDKDPMVAMLEHTFNAHIEFEINEFNRYIKAGQMNNKSKND